MFRFCLSLLLVVALSWDGTVLAQTPSESESSAEPSPAAQTTPGGVESDNSLGAGLSAPTLAVLAVLGVVLLGTTVTVNCNDSVGCGGPSPITTATGTR
jgi:hypothetical protein